MALIDRIFRDVTGDSTIRRSNHLLMAGFWMWARGDITRAQFVSALELEPSDSEQVDQLKAAYESLNPQAEKDRFFGDFTAWSIAAEEGKITKAQFRTRFGLT